MAENPRIEELRRRVEADPASVAFAALAEEFRRAGSYHDAIETCRTGLQRHPSYISARVTLGRALIETGEYDAARAELEIVLKAAPENLAAIRAMADIHERLGLGSPQASTGPIAVAQAAVESKPQPAASPANVLEWTPPLAPPMDAAPAAGIETASDSTADAAAVGRLEAFLAAIQAARTSDRAAL